MPRLIFTSRYRSNVPAAQLANLVGYMGTRPGVELCRAEWAELPATEKQQALITRLQSELPDMTGLAEYGDYQRQPSRENASELITAVTEQYADSIIGREQFVRYMGMRPRVERVGEHGLFTQKDTSRTLNEIVEEVANHQGRVWSHVLSLRREDAARLGYDNQTAYSSLLRNHLSLLAQAHKIAPEHLRWVAAYHDESHHPHLHLLVYSADPNEEFLTNTGIERMRGGFARDIFHDTLRQLYNAQTDARNALREQAKSLVQELSAQTGVGDCVDRWMAELLQELHDGLETVTGRLVYRYLPRESKQMVDAVIDRLAENEQIAGLYVLWQKQRNAVLQTYTDKEPELLPLSRCEEFRPIQNAVIRVALSLPSRAPAEEPGWDEKPSAVALEEPELLDLPDTEEPKDVLPTDVDCFHMSWSQEYKAVRRLWYQNRATDAVLEQAFILMLTEAQKGNVLAVHDVGKMLLDGIGCEKDEEEAQQWFRLALTGFMEVEAAAEKRDYIQYRIGKMFAFGYGTGQDHAQAAGWYRKAVDAGNSFAAYSLGGLYQMGQGVDKNESAAFSLYTMAAEDEKCPNAYAMYELGGMCRSGRGTEKDEAQSKRWYTLAYPRFVAMEQENGDDKLFYRLGKMNLSGLGTPVDYDNARTYLEKAAVLKTANAYYALGTLYLKKEYAGRDPQQAVTWLIRAAALGHDFAQYTLGKLFLYDGDIPQDREQGLYWLHCSAAQGNVYAARLLENALHPPVSPVMAAISLLQGVARLLDGQMEIQRLASMHTDSKLLAEIAEKKARLGIQSGQKKPQVRI